MAATFDIVNITPRTRQPAPGTFVKVQEVTFITKPSSIGGTVDVAADDFTPDTVNAAVTAQAATLEAVKAL